jgi:uncharacterized protein YndB with AHSA1/START domain
MNENDHTRTRPPERPDEPVNLPEDRTIRSSRTLQATRARVWPLFENRADLVAWWGPSGFVNTFEEFDFNPGGAWKLVMHAPDGSAYPMNKRFIRIEAPHQLVIDHIDEAHGFRMFIRLHEHGETTRLEWIMVFDRAEEAAKVRPFVEAANEQNFDRLADYLFRKPS